MRPPWSEFASISHLTAGFNKLAQNMERYNRLSDWQYFIKHPETEEFPALAAYVFSLPLADAKRKFGQSVSRSLGAEMNKSIEVIMARMIEYTQSQDDFTVTFQSLSIIDYKRRALEKLLHAWPLPAGIDVEAAWKDLMQFLDEDFRRLDIHSHPEERLKTLVLTIPAGKRLLWDAPPLQDAVTLSDSFSNFRNFGLKNKYPALQPLQSYLEQLMRPLVEELIKSDITRAQRFEDKSSLRSIPANEAELRTDSQNFADTTELLKQLLKKLDQLRFTTLQTGLASLVRSNAIDQLQAINALLNSERLYEPAVGFGAWDGGPGLNLLAFAVPDQGALGAYLIAQRERVATLANQYARPSLSYLVQSSQPAGPLTLRWRQLITDLDDYYSNRPDNSIADLENFILGELGTITAAGCSSRIAASADRIQGDFFVLKRLELQRGMLARCDKVAAVKVNSAYRTLAAAFNNQLAGRFPFVTTPVANTLSRLPGGDAEPSVIRAVFSLSEQLPDNVKAAMSSGDAGSARLSASELAFLNALAATRPVLMPWLDAKPGDAVPALGFSIEFRVNRVDEIGGDQIIEWTLETGTRRIRATDKDLRGRWQFGEPVRLGLRWASGSPWRPATNRARPDLQVKDETVTWVYPDGWALFKLIGLNRLYPGAGWQEGGDILMLTVPVQRVAPESGNILRGEARVFVRLLLLGPPNPQGQAQPLTFPLFPTYAPSS